MCHHTKTTCGPDGPFSRGLSGDNPAAHGCISYMETCSACGAERLVNQNQNFFEFDTWGPDRVTRERAEKEAADTAAMTAAREAGVTDMSWRPGRDVLEVCRHGHWSATHRDLLQQAADQEDAQLALIYRGILLLSDSARECWY